MAGEETYEQLQARRAQNLAALKSLKQLLEQLLEGVTIAEVSYWGGRSDSALEVLAKVQEVLRRADGAVADLLKSIH